MNPGYVILIGMGAVFSGLILLIISIAILNWLIGLFGRKAEAESSESVQPVQVDDGIDHDVLVAVIASSIAAATDTDAEGLRIVSLKRI